MELDPVAITSIPQLEHNLLTGKSVQLRLIQHPRLVIHQVKWTISTDMFNLDLGKQSDYKGKITCPNFYWDMID